MARCRDLKSSFWQPRNSKTFQRPRRLSFERRRIGNHGLNRRLRSISTLITARRILVLPGLTQILSALPAHSLQLSAIPRCVTILSFRPPTPASPPFTPCCPSHLF